MNHPQLLTASAPFDRTNVDVVLRTSDSVDFNVYKNILALASPVFADIFDVPQPAIGAQQDMHPVLNVPLVHITENSQTLDNLLRLIYPVADPVLKDAAGIAAVLSAAMKYEMEEATRLMEATLRDGVANDPSRAYAIACRLGLEELAGAAAMVCARGDIDYVSDMDDITSGALYRLLHFRRVQPRNVGSFTFSAPQGAFVRQVAERGRLTGSHPFNKPSADIVMRSSDGVHFHVHRLILTLASTVFAHRLKQRPQADDISPQGMRMLAVTEDSRTVAKLLQLCYPMQEPDVEDLDTAHALLAAAKKYEIAGALMFAQRKWMSHVHTQPLRAYFIAMRHQWIDGAREAADHLIFQPSDVYVPEMEDVSASVYHRLLQYRHSCREIISCVDSAYFGIRSSPRHWSDLSYDGEAYGAYESFLLEFHCSALSNTSGPTTRAVIAAPVVERAVGYAFHARLTQLVKDSQHLEAELHEKFSKVRVAEQVLRTCCSYPNS
ncbi:hypothetical protein BKA93DRAFT_736544 [Sparassis latifolia]